MGSNGNDHVVELTTMKSYSDHGDHAPPDDLEMTLPMDHVPDQRTRGSGGYKKFLIFVICLVVGLVVAVAASNRSSSSGQQGDSSGGGGSTEVISGNKEEIEAWLKAPVVLADGIKYEVVSQLVHDPDAFTEGFTYGNGVIYESTGLNHKSSIRTLNETSGEIISIQELDPKYFGEGLTYVDGKLYQLTYKKKTGFIFDASDLSRSPQTFTYDTTTGEGWGLTYDPTKKELIVSDGSEYLHFWDVHTLKFKRKTQVRRQNDVNARNINELEWWRGRVLANVWFEDIILVIHPETGVVEKEYQFKDLWPKILRKNNKAGVLNGISVSRDPDLLYITGKNWDRTYLVKLLY